MRLVFVGTAVVVEGIVFDGHLFAGEHVDADAARAEVAVLKSNRSFISLDLKTGGYVANQCGVVDGDVFVVGVKP